MCDEQIGRGEVRMEPVDVDVLDNLINAQAADMDALEGAYKHHGIESISDEEVLHPLFRAMSMASGTLLLQIAASRV